jgi:hypothetical protein
MSGQCIPYPAPAIFQFARCSGVACSKRGYQARGTVMVRPSKRSTLIASSVKRTSLTRSPDFLFTDNSNILSFIRRPEIMKNIAGLHAKVKIYSRLCTSGHTGVMDKILLN